MDFNQKIIEEFRANKGVVGGPFEGKPLMLVTCKGAKSGKEITFPVMYTTDGDKYVIIASKGGAPDNPAWYYNLVANPGVTVEMGTEKFQARTTNAEEPERTRLFDQQAAQYPQFREYQEKTTRKIPVFTIERV